MNVGNIFKDSVKIRPNRVALIQGDRQFTYGDLDTRTNQVANGLRDLGVGPGDTVGVLVKNDIRFVECMFGALRLGAVVTPVTTRAHYDTLAHIMEDSEAKVLIASSHFAEEAARLKAGVSGLGHVLVMDTAVGGTVDYDPWREAAAITDVDTPVDDGDLCLLPYTSGSTGLPKGVLLSHHNVEWWTRAVRRAMLLGPEDRALLAIPVFHANGMFMALMPMLEGGGSLVMLHDFAAREVIAALSREECTYTTGVPAMYKLLLREEDLIAKTDFSSLQFVLCGSSEVPEELLSEFEARFGAPMLEGYGLTEGGPLVCYNPRWGISKHGTSGLPYPGVELRVVDPDNPTKDVPQGDIGELLIRSPAPATGYHKLPQVTKERFLEGQWLRTKDLVRADEQGYIKIVGRQDDMINCGGENVYPKEVENVLMTHANIADVAVVPVPDEVKGEVPVAFAVEKKSGDTSPEALKQYFLDNGPAYAHPRKVFIVDELPLTGAKKVGRTRLKELARE